MPNYKKCTPLCAARFLTHWMFFPCMRKMSVHGGVWKGIGGRGRVVFGGRRNGGTPTLIVPPNFSQF